MPEKTPNTTQRGSFLVLTAPAPKWTPNSFSGKQERDHTWTHLYYGLKSISNLRRPLKSQVLHMLSEDSPHPTRGTFQVDALGTAIVRQTRKALYTALAAKAT